MRPTIRRFVPVVLLAAALCSTTATTTSAATTPQIATGDITQGSTSSPTGMCLDDSRGSTSTGNTIDLASCNDSWSEQVWTVEADGTIRDQNMCLDAPGTASKTDVVLESCTSGTAGQQWHAASGTLVNPNSGLCLGQSGSAQGDSLWIFTCDGANTQVWNLPAVGTATAAASAAARLQQMYDPSNGLFESSCSDTSPGGNCWWWSANELDALIDYYEQQPSTPFPGSTTYLNDIQNTFSLIPDFRNGVYDDEGWWGLTWLNAYQLTGNSSYLQTAETLFYDINQNGWDGTCGGGVWQSADTSTHLKDAIANELYIGLGAELYRATGDSGYLNGSGTTPSGKSFNSAGSFNSGAEGAWQWLLNSGMITTVSSNPTRMLVNDHITSSCAAATTQKWSYFQGVVLGALGNLYKITGDATTYLTPAEEIAAGVLADQQTAAGSDQGTYSTPALLDTSGVLSEACDPDTSADWPSGCSVTNGSVDSFLQYKGIFIRNLYCLSRLDDTGDSAPSTYAAFIANNATAIFASDQNTSTSNVGAQNLNEFGFVWDKWSTTQLNEATQGSALEALSASMDSSFQMCGK